MLGQRPRRLPQHLVNVDQMYQSCWSDVACCTLGHPPPPPYLLLQLISSFCRFSQALISKWPSQPVFSSASSCTCSPVLERLAMTTASGTSKITVTSTPASPPQATRCCRWKTRTRAPGSVWGTTLPAWPPCTSLSENDAGYTASTTRVHLCRAVQEKLY